MAMVALEPVAAPAPRTPRLSLLVAARDVLADPARAGERWENGFAYVAQCGSAGIRDACARTEMEPPGQPGLVAAVPFDVWAASDCPSVFGAVTDAARAELRQRALDNLNVCQGPQIEAELWTGALAQEHNADAAEGDVWPNRWLASPDTVDLGGGDPVEALACLERSLAGCACGVRGMIHATADTVTWWDHFGLLRTEGAVLLTRNDTVVVPGAGYDGTSPDGETPETGAWAYATGMVDIRMGAVQEPTESFDRAVNSLVYRALRRAAVTWDGCCAFGVHVQFDSCLPAGS